MHSRGFLWTTQTIHDANYRFSPYFPESNILCCYISLNIWWRLHQKWYNSSYVSLFCCCCWNNCKLRNHQTQTHVPQNIPPQSIKHLMSLVDKKAKGIMFFLISKNRCAWWLSGVKCNCGYLYVTPVFLAPPPPQAFSIRFWRVLSTITVSPSALLPSCTKFYWTKWSLYNGFCIVIYLIL